MLIKVSKLDAAKRQLETVIRMYFCEGDPVSIHTLTAAAYNVLRALNNKAGGGPMLIKDRVVMISPPNYTKEVRCLINQAENFFKHADKDHDSVLDFNPQLTEYLLIDACDKYHELAGEYPALMAIYRCWMMVTNQELFRFSAVEKVILDGNAKELVAGGKATFFKDMLLANMKNGF
jgi:hypothetical protein